MTTREEIKNFFENSIYGEELLIKVYNNLFIAGIKRESYGFYKYATDEDLEEFKEFLINLYRASIKERSKIFRKFSKKENKIFFFNENNDSLIKILENDLLSRVHFKKLYLTEKNKVYLINTLMNEIAHDFCYKYNIRYFRPFIEEKGA